MVTGGDGVDDQARGQRRMGRGMIIAFWVLVLGLGTWWFQGMLDERRNPNASVAEVGGDGRVVLERNRSGHFVATGRVNGEPVTFLLDTGATYVTVSPGTASRLGLQRGPAATFSTANGRVRGHLARLDSVALGGLAARDVRGAVNPGLGDGIALLGMSYLGHFDIQLNGERMIIRARQ